MLPDYCSPEFVRACHAAERRMIILHSMTELRRWVNDMMGPDADERIVAAVADEIRGDPAAPRWGSDWAEYLCNVPNLWEIADAATGPDVDGGEG